MTENIFQTENITTYDIMWPLPWLVRDTHDSSFKKVLDHGLLKCKGLPKWYNLSYCSEIFLFILNHGIKHLFHKALKWVITALYCPFRCYYYCDRKHFCVHDKVLSVLILLYCAQTYWQDEIFSLTGTIKVWVNS